MKVSRICVTLLVVFGMVTSAASARAEINTNFVKDFLSRYRPARNVLPATPGVQSPQDVASLVRSSQLPLTVGDLINLMLQNNLDIGVNCVFQQPWAGILLRRHRS